MKLGMDRLGHFDRNRLPGCRKVLSDKHETGNDDVQTIYITGLAGSALRTRCDQG